MTAPLRILQVSTADAGGGAERVAAGLARRHREHGATVWRAVGHRTTDAPDVFKIGVGTRRLVRLATRPHVLLDYIRGHEDFGFPGTHSLLDRLPQRPHIVHCHNLHGGYFDLRALPWLTRELPVMVTLHDAWMLTGHCAQSFDCERWKTGCGDCPDLTIEPAIRRDATAFNWGRKRGIYANSRVYVAAPSRWLMDNAEQSMLAPAIAGRRVIPNGVDLSVFCIGDRQAARTALGIPRDAHVLVTTVGRHGSLWRDHAMLRDALCRVAARLPARHIHLIVLGGDARDLRINGMTLVEPGYVDDETTMSSYFQAADIYVHAARADTFPTAVIEALGCGAPVVATRVGGIAEQISDGVTGIGVPAGDSLRFAEAVVALLTDEPMRRTMSYAAARDARDRFDVRHHADAYLDWYRTIIADWNRDTASAS